MNKRVLTIVFAVLLSLVGAKAGGISPSYFSEVTEGDFYLYNVAQQQFLVRLSNNFPGLTNAPVEVKITKSGTAYTIMFVDGKYLKTGYWNNQYLWTDGSAGLNENLWAFDAISGETNVYQIHRTASETLNDQTGVFYVNGTNAALQPTDDCMWALIKPSAYISIAMEKAIPAEFRSDVPTAEGQYYLYDVLNQQFLNTEYRSLSDVPSALTGLTPAPSPEGEESGKFLLSGAKDKYLKIGVYKGQYLWSDGDADNTKWTLEQNDDKLFYIYTNDFTETNTEVAGKTMYLQETNATATKPSFARWALITEDDYVAWAMSGEATADPAVVAENLTAIKAAKGDATSLVENPSFAKGDGGWRGGTRTLCTLYRGNGYDYESTDANARMIQILNNMPAGTYKVVAIVRGASGTTAKAIVANTEGDVVQNHGYQGDFQLNINGVMMPYSIAGGFNTSDNALGWQWLTATGTLAKEGNLTIEFDLNGADWKGIADVHLYYMSDGTNKYAIDYTDGVDAQNHAVCCDLTTDNPNRLFSATGNIKTVTDENLNNLLVSGAVANFVLWDVFDFTASADFIAKKATYYRTIEAGTLNVLCLPFTITGGTNGTFYEPKNISGGTLNLKEVKKPEAGKTYLYLGTSEVTALTGSGNVKGGVFAKVAAPQGSYVLNGNKLKKVSGNTTVEAFRAYFQLESDASSLSLNFDTTDDDSVWQRPQLATSALVAGQEYYLYNVAAQRFYTEGNSYGTQASVGEEGLKCKFVQSGEVYKLTNFSKAKNAWRTLFVTTNGAMFVDAESATECWWNVVPIEHSSLNIDHSFKLMMAAPNKTYNQENYPSAMMGLDIFGSEYATNLAALLMEAEEPGEGFYLTDWAVATPDAYSQYLNDMATYKAALQLKELIDEAKSVGMDVTEDETVYNNTASTLAEIQAAIASVTTKLLEDDLAGASRENPIDVTDKFITNPRYENNDNEGWKGNVQPGIDANNNLQNAEFFNTNFDTYQDLQGLPDGTYRLSLQGYYRAGLEGPAYEAKQSGSEPLNAELYVITDSKTTTTKMQSIFTGAPTSKLGVDGEINLGQWWVPNTMSAAAVYFAKDYYKDNSIEVQVTNGQLRIGLRKSTTIRRDWVMIDNWKLEYLGK